jgi:O-antigen ligase
VLTEPTSMLSNTPHVRATAFRGGPPMSARNSAFLITGAGVILSAGLILAAMKVGLPFAAVLLALVVGAGALVSPVAAVVILFMTMFFRLPLGEFAFPSDPFVIAFGLLLVAMVVWIDRTPIRVRGVDAVQRAMLLYLAWNVYSMLAPHRYTSGPQMPNADLSNLPLTPMAAPRFIVIAVVIPLVLYTVGRYVFESVTAVCVLLWTILAIASYSALVSVMPSVGLSEFVWPRYIVEDPGWPGRAVGVFNQPVVNGMVLALGFVIAVALRRFSQRPWVRCMLVLLALACGWGLFETHTRAAWLSGAIVLLLGALLARGFRTGFVTGLVVVMGAIAANWATFTSADRSAGGIASEDEVWDRLNTLKTGLWAVYQHPFSGWGIGRFEAINTYHHQQWSLEAPWARGYGIISHGNEIAIAAELGLIGLVLWLATLIVMAYRLRSAYRTLPVDKLCGMPLALLAIASLSILLVTGLTVDLRYFDLPTAIVFLLAGVTAGQLDRVRDV